MNIQMIGIDHTKAGIAEREAFSFTKRQAASAMEEIKKESGVSGCILLSTCNRMELWVSLKEECRIPLYKILCHMKHVDRTLYPDLFTEREGVSAVSHLLFLASGMKSQIIGEDQIISQVKDALSFARECGCTDSVMEVLFRTAVTAGKKIKTEVSFSKANSSVIPPALDRIEETYGKLSGKTCMVIGNGEMGKLAALALLCRGANVTVTVRQYRSGIVEIPEGCARIHYGERMQFLPNCELVVSATASPNYTLKKEELEKISHKDGLILLDLAVPRDISPELKKEKDLILYDMDDFRNGIEEEGLLQKEREHAGVILTSYLEDFISWYECRDMLPKIQEIQQKSVTDLSLRLNKKIQGLGLSHEEQEQLQSDMDTAMGKVVGKLLFGLRDSVSTETLRSCLDGIISTYQ